MTKILPPIIVDVDAKIDFYAGNEKSIQQLKPIYLALSKERRGKFYASPSLAADFPVFRLFRNSETVAGFDPLVVASYRDLNSIFFQAEDRPFIFLENEFTQDARGLLNVVALFLCNDERSFNFRSKLKKPAEKINCPEDIILKLEKFIQGNQVNHIDHIGAKTVGMIYMAFGEKAFQAVKQSVASLRRLGISYPVTIVGDFSSKNPSLDKFNCKQWQGDFPFDRSKKHNFQFRAGRIKPLLYSYSEYDLNLYLDADTLFVQPIEEGFSYLAKNDLVVTEEKLTLKQLYNKHLAGWELNLLERDVTIAELDNNANQKFINSGVFFFKQSDKIKKLFNDWRLEWLRFQEWDEQLALMRSIHKHPEVKIKKLPVEWNDPSINDNSIIFHNYGRGSIRMNL